MGYKEFNKGEFAELLRVAKGKRSINKYGLDSGVDTAYISRLLRGLLDKPPGASIINKLASKAHNNITLEQLMICAGYLSTDDEETFSSIKKDLNLSDQLTFLIFQEIAEKYDLDLRDAEQRQTVEDAFKLIFGRKK